MINKKKNLVKKFEQLYKIKNMIKLKKDFKKLYSFNKEHFFRLKLPLKYFTSRSKYLFKFFIKRCKILKRFKSHLKFKLRKGRLQRINRTKYYQQFRQRKSFFNFISNKSSLKLRKLEKKSSRFGRRYLRLRLHLRLSRRLKIKKLKKYRHTYRHRRKRFKKWGRRRKRRLKRHYKKKKLYINQKKIIYNVKRFENLFIMPRYKMYKFFFNSYYKRKFSNLHQLKRNIILQSRLVIIHIINQFFKDGKKINSLKLFLQLIKDFQRLSNIPKNFRYFLPRIYALQNIITPVKVIIPRKGKKKKNRKRQNVTVNTLKVTQKKLLFVTFKMLFNSVRVQKNRIPFCKQLLIELLKIFTGRKCIFYELVLKRFRVKYQSKPRVYKRLKKFSFKYKELPIRFKFDLIRLKKKNKSKNKSKIKSKNKFKPKRLLIYSKQLKSHSNKFNKLKKKLKIGL